MPRSDMSPYLVHWTKGPTHEEAFDTLCSIVREGRLLGGAEGRFGSYASISFTEAPPAMFHEVNGLFKPFGIQVSKRWLFSRGGRPVIYQPNHEAVLLDESIRWRHVNYEPNLEWEVQRQGFSWQREWRHPERELLLPPEEVTVLLPTLDWEVRLRQLHDDEEYGRVYYVNSMLDGWYDWPRPFPFQTQSI